MSVPYASNTYKSNLDKKRPHDEDGVQPSPKRTELEEGRVTRKKTMPSVITPARSSGYISDLRRKLSRGPTYMPLRQTSTPANPPFMKPVVPTPNIENRNVASTPRMKTKYVKIITKY